MGQQSDEIEEGLTDRLKVPVWVKLAIVAVILPDHICTLTILLL